MAPKRKDIFVLLFLQLVLLILFAFFGRYGDAKDCNKYPMFQDVHIMIFVGFGFLMTFLRRYGYSAVGFNLLLASLIIQWAVLCQGFYQINEEGKIKIGYTNLFEADVASATVLISMGAVLGKTSYIQLIVMGVVEIAAFSANFYLGTEIFKAVDDGGSIFVHVFGAYFGLAVSFVLYKRRREPLQDNSLEGASYTSDLFAMIGTVFLWAFWPSFNAIELQGDDQLRAVINTYLSLAASCVVAFATSAAVNPEKKFRMDHVQNSTLAGGVAIGAAARLMVQPCGAVIIGILAGLLSVLGFKYASPLLLKYLKIHDTCGVNNLHGMPGILAALVSAVMAGIATEAEYNKSLYSIYPARAHKNVTFSDLELEYVNNQSPAPGSEENRTAEEQAGYQILALIVTLAIAVVSGIISGLIIVWFPENSDPYDDSIYWTMPEKENSS